MKLSTCMVYAVIARAVTDDETITHEAIAEMLDLSTQTVSACVAELVTAGHIQAEREKTGMAYTYQIINMPPLADRLLGWLYRFSERERVRRMMAANVAARIFYKAAELNRMRLDDPSFTAARAELLDQYPDLRDLFAVWPLDEATQIETALDQLLDWQKESHEHEVSIVG